MQTSRIALAAFTIVALAGATTLAFAGGGEACRAAAFGPQPKFVEAKASPWPVGPMAGRPVVGDVNNDNHADIVVACGTCCGSPSDPKGGHVFVLLGDSTGMFKAAPGSPLKVGPSVRKIALGDVNGDRYLDIIAAEHDSHDLTVLVGDGSGGFKRSGATPPCVMNGPIKNPANGEMVMPQGHTHEVALADVNADGRMDILAGTVAGHGLAVLINQNDGSFKHATGSPNRVRTPYDAIATADMNGDSRIDIVVPSVAGGSVYVMLGDGAGAFAQAEGSPFKVAERPGYVATGDCNGDGKIDVFVTHDDLTTLDILLNDGQGRLAAAPNSPIDVKGEGFLWGIAPVDLNADGRLDLAIGNAVTNKVTLLLGDGKGTFMASETDVRAGSGAGYATAADVNADGRVDLITGNYESGDVSILLAVKE